MVKSISCPTAETIGMRDANIARATSSSLNAHKSSNDPPPRPMIMTSTSFMVFKSRMPWAISFADPSPCTFAGRSRTETLLFLLRMTLRISRTAAPVGEVTTPIFQGKAGSGFFASSSNKPSFSSFAFNCSKAFCRAPSPLGSRDSVMIWYSPRAS